MIKVLIADDEKPARTELRYLLERFDDVHVVGEAADGESVLCLNCELKPDLIFMDIQMPLFSGIETAEILLNSDNSPFIIFVTAYDSYAVKAFELHAIDYLLKPVESARLDAGIERIRKLLDSGGQPQGSVAEMKKMLSGFRQSRTPGMITVCRDEKFYPVPFEKIKYAFADGKHTYLVSQNGRFHYKNTLQKLEEVLPSNFIRTHRGFIVNMNFIIKIEPWFNSSYQISLEGEDNPVPLSRSHARHFRDIMKME